MPSVSGEHEAAQIYLIADVGPTTADRLMAALDAASVATVLLVAGPGERLAAPQVKPLVEAIQDRGIAALIADDAALARTVRADGVHLSGGADVAARYGEARDILGTRYIVGSEVGTAGADIRHDAMSLGETGADYVGFGALSGGAPGAGGGAGGASAVAAAAAVGTASHEGLLDHLDWWSEIFEVPCVAFVAATPGEARSLAEAGADFIAVRLPRAAAAADIKAAMTAFGAALALDGAAAVAD